jgi:hypothetical protein
LKVIDSIIVKNKTQFEFNKILVKNINLKKSVAFEVTSKFSTKIIDIGNVHSDLQLVGEVDLKDFLKKNKLKGKLLLTSKNLYFEKLNKKIPEFKQRIEFEHDGRGVNLFKTELFSDVVSLNAKGKLANETLNLDQFELEVDSSILKKDSLIALNESKILCEGSLKINLSSFKLIPNVKVKMTKPIFFNVDSIDSMALDISGEIVGNKVTLNSKSKIREGFVNQSLSMTLKHFIDKDIQDFKYNLSIMKMNLSGKEYKAFRQVKIKLPAKIKKKSFSIKVVDSKVNNSSFSLASDFQSSFNIIDKFSLRLKSKDESLNINLRKGRYDVRAKKINSTLIKDLFFSTFPVLNSQIDSQFSYQIKEGTFIYSKGYIKGLGGEFKNANLTTILKTNKIKDYKLVMKTKKKKHIETNLIVNGEKKLFRIQSIGTISNNLIDLDGSLNLNSKKIPFQLIGPLETPNLEIAK